MLAGRDSGDRLRWLHPGSQSPCRRAFWLLTAGTDWEPRGDASAGASSREAHPPAGRISGRTTHAANGQHLVLAVVRDISQRKAMEKAEAIFKRLFESSPDSIVVTDRDGCIREANPQTERLFGYSRDELIGNPVEMLIPERFRNMHVHHRGDYDAEPRVRPMGIGLDLFGRKKDGSEFPVDIMLSPVWTNGEHVVLAIVRDITIRKNSEKALRQSEERFRQLVDGARDYAIFMLDTEGRVTSWNPGAECIKGYRAEEILGQHFSRFYTQEDIDHRKPWRALEEAKEKGRYEDEGWRLRKDGSRFWANVVITALRDESGQLRGFLKITRDLTDRKRAEENARRLAEEEARRSAAEDSAREAQQAQQEERRHREQLHVTLASIGDAVIVTDIRGTVTFLNPTAQALTGWDPQEAAGQPLERVFHIVNEDTRQVVENPVARVLREGTVVGLANHTLLIARDGQEIPIDDSGAPIRGEDGTIAGVVLVFRDVTEARRAVEARLHLAAIVESTDDAIMSTNLDGVIVSWNQGAE